MNLYKLAEIIIELAKTLNKTSNEIAQIVLRTGNFSSQDGETLYMEIWLIEHGKA